MTRNGLCGYGFGDKLGPGTGRSLGVPWRNRPQGLQILADQGVQFFFWLRHHFPLTSTVLRLPAVICFLAFRQKTAQADYGAVLQGFDRPYRLLQSMGDLL